MRDSGAVHIISISAPSASGGVVVLASRRIASICPVLSGLCYAGLSVPFPAAIPDKTCQRLSLAARPLYSLPHTAFFIVRAQLEPDGTRRRAVGEVKGKHTRGVGSQ